MRGKKWTEEKLARLKELAYLGKSIKDIANELDTTESSITNALHNYKIHRRVSRSHWTDDELNLLEELWTNSNKSMSILVKELGRNEQSIRHKAGELGLNARAFYADGYSASEIAKEIGVSKNTVYRWIKNKGLKAVKRRDLNLQLIVPENELIKWLKENQDMYNASNIDRYFIKNQPWLNEKIKQDSMLIHDKPVKTRKNKWTDEEASTVKNLVVRGKTVKQIAKRVNRTETAIIKYMEAHDIKSSKQAVWTDEEYKILKDNIDAPIYILLKLLPDRTKNAISGKRAELKKGTREPRITVDWTEEEDRIITKNCDKPRKELYKLLPNRTIPAIDHRIKVLGLIKHEKSADWSIEEDELLIANINKTADELMNMLHRSKSSIISRKARLRKKGLATKAESKWTKEETEILLNNPNLSISELMKLLPDKNKNAITSKKTYLRTKGMLSKNV